MTLSEPVAHRRQVLRPSATPPRRPAWKDSVCSTRCQLYSDWPTSIHENDGSLGGACLEHTHEIQVAGINELIRSDEPSKAKSLLSLLSTEGIYVWSKGEQPPPLLTLVKVPEFVGLPDVWKRLVDLGAETSEDYHGETDARVAEQTKSAVRLCLLE